MQYKYITCELPSNGLIYSTKEVHLRAKTIFDIKMLLGNPVFQLRSEIDALNNCIDPKDNIDVYDLVNQDVVYLLYKLRSMSDDNLTLLINNKEYPIKLSELEVKKLESYDPNRILPDSGHKVILELVPIKAVFNNAEKQRKFRNKFPEYHGDINNVITILDSIKMFNNLTDKTFIRNALEELSFKDSLYLVEEIEKFNQQDFGIKEEVTITNEKGQEVTVPIQITEAFFRPTF